MVRKIRLKLAKYAKIIALWSFALAAVPAHAVEYAADGLRDPFRPLIGDNGPVSGPAVPAEGFTLQGILWSPASPQAIVNGQVVKPGDRVEGAEVAAIERRLVRLSIDGEERILTLEKKF